MSNGSIITNLGKKILLNRTYKPTPDYAEPNQIKIGIENGTPNIVDTNLDKPVPIAGTESVDTCEAADWTDGADATTSLNSTTYKQGSYALNITKDGVASDTALTYKTTTSIDFTSKDFWIWLYIKDATAYAKLAATDCLTIRFGSDNTNYYTYTRDAADLAVGWNAVTFNTTTADSTTGSPVISACDYSYIALKATGSAITWSAGDFIMDDLKAASSNDYFKGLDSGYPTIDETNNEVELRFTVSTTDANGYDINSMALFNDDASPLMADEDTFDSESKSNTDEFVFIIIDRIV